MVKYDFITYPMIDHGFQDDSSIVHVDSCGLKDHLGYITSRLKCLLLVGFIPVASQPGRKKHRFLYRENAWVRVSFPQKTSTSFGGPVGLSDNSSVPEWKFGGSEWLEGCCKTTSPHLPDVEKPQHALQSRDSTYSTLVYHASDSTWVPHFIIFIC